MTFLLEAQPFQKVSSINIGLVNMFTGTGLSSSKRYLKNRHRSFETRFRWNFENTYLHHRTHPYYTSYIHEYMLQLIQLFSAFMFKITLTQLSAHKIQSFTYVPTENVVTSFKRTRIRHKIGTNREIKVK